MYILNINLYSSILTCKKNYNINMKIFYYLEKYHFERFLTNNAWIQKMSVEEWAFFTERQNPCGTLKDPINGKLSCKLKRGTAFCKERLKLREKPDALSSRIFRFFNVPILGSFANTRKNPVVQNSQKHFSNPKYELRVSFSIKKLSPSD